MMKLELGLCFIALVGLVQAGDSEQEFKGDPHQLLFNGPKMTLDDTYKTLVELNRQYVHDGRKAPFEEFYQIIPIFIKAQNVSEAKCNNDDAFWLQSIIHTIPWDSESLDEYALHYGRLQYDLCRDKLFVSCKKRLDTLKEAEKRDLYSLIDDIVAEASPAGRKVGTDRNGDYESYSPDTLEYFESVPEQDLARGVLRFMKRQSRIDRGWNEGIQDFGTFAAHFKKTIVNLCSAFQDSTDETFQHLGYGVSPRIRSREWSPITVERVCRQILKQKQTVLRNAARILRQKD